MADVQNSALDIINQALFDVGVLGLGQTADPDGVYLAGTGSRAEAGSIMLSTAPTASAIAVIVFMGFSLG